jgi:sorting nexin-1/2
MSLHLLTSLSLIILQAERRCLEAKHEFDHVSKLVKSEVARFERERVEDFKESLHQFLEGMISRQREVCECFNCNS